jgi:21S rRNA (GM2251-2'-O)-methyltransferase
VKAVLRSQPKLLVLRSEGHGLRTMVAKACSEFVRIPAGTGGDDDATGVDSLTVSVTGGILLWQILNGGKR